MVRSRGRDWRSGGRPVVGGVRLRARDEELELAAWRAGVDEQLRSIREDIADLRVRIGGMLLIVAGAAVGQVVIRLLTGK